MFKVFYKDSYIPLLSLALGAVGIYRLFTAHKAVSFPDYSRTSIMRNKGGGPDFG
jgi:hypothetical protein